MMIKYQLKIKNAKGDTIQIYSGEVSDTGEIAFDIPREEVQGGFIRIDWEVADGNDSNK